MSPLFLLYRSVWVVLDWLYPPQCAGCQKTGYRWCEECQGKSPKVSEEHCIFCKRRLPEDGDCSGCLEQRRNLDRVYAWGYHDGPLRQALHKLKYRRDLGLGEVLAKHMIEVANQNSLDVEVVVPVPLGRKRKRERGYNQAALLARPIAMGLGLPYRTAALKRIRETQSQVGLTIEQRRENVADAFQADPKLVSCRKVGLIDDVMTTGATLEASASALKQAGAVEISGLILARTL